MSNEFDEGKKSPAGRRNSAIHQEESLRWAREHESRIRRNSGGAGQNAARPMLLPWVSTGNRRQTWPETRESPERKRSRRVPKHGAGSLP